MTRVLVVEDEESFSDALAFMLEREGYEVAVAADGNVALEELVENAVARAEAIAEKCFRGFMPVNR